MVVGVKDSSLNPECLYASPMCFHFCYRILILLACSNYKGLSISNCKPKAYYLLILKGETTVLIKLELMRETRINMELHMWRAWAGVNVVCDKMLYFLSSLRTLMCTTNTFHVEMECKQGNWSALDYYFIFFFFATEHLT